MTSEPILAKKLITMHGFVPRINMLFMFYWDVMNL